MTTTVSAPVVIPPRLRHPAVAPLAIGMLGFAISVIGIGIPSIWYDEAATITSTTRSWPQLWAELGNVDAVHGLYYALMHALFDVVGYSPIALRMPSALAIGAAAGLVAVLGRLLSGPRLAIIAGLIFIILPRVTWAGSEGRSYAMTALLAVALTVVFVKAQRDTRRRWWVVYAALAVLSATMFLYLALVVVAHAITVAWRLLRRDPLAVFVAKRWGLATAAAAVLSLPLAAEIISQSGQVAWIQPIGAGTPVQVFRSQWFYTSMPFAVVAWALIIVGTVSLLRRGERVVLPALVLPTLALLAISVVHSPLYQPRYLTMCLPFVALVMAAGLSSIRWRWAAASGLMVLLVLAIPQIVSQRVPEAKENSSWSQVAETIAADRAADGPDSVTAFIYGNLQRHPKATARVMAYSYPYAFADSIDTTILTPAAETAQLWETRAPVSYAPTRLVGADVAYLITSNARDLRGETIAALSEVGWRVVDRWDFTSVHVLKFEPVG